MLRSGRLIIDLSITPHSSYTDIKYDRITSVKQRNLLKVLGQMRL